MPIIIIGGKGWFTATESAGIAVIYAIVLCAFFYRELSFKGLYESCSETGRLAAVALFCVGTASAFGWLLAYYQIPKAILAGVSAWGLGFYGTGFFIASCSWSWAASSTRSRRSSSSAPSCSRSRRRCTCTRCTSP
jgi:TRAP-type mannitol/chloroaromatic compound transport system permease large subunit